MGLRSLTCSDLNADARAALLEGSKWSKDLDWEQIKTLAEFMQHYAVTPGFEVVHEGAHDNYMGLVINGALHVFRQDGEGGQKEITVLGKDKSFGEMSLIDGQPRSATLAARGETELLVLTSDNFLALSKHAPDIVITLLRKIATSLSARLRRTSSQLVEILDSE